LDEHLIEVIQVLSQINIGFMPVGFRDENPSIKANIHACGLDAVWVEGIDDQPSSPDFILYGSVTENDHYSPLE
jgi:hypothetical protein